jgi:hypothetical protein
MGQFAGRTWLAWKEARNKDKMCQMTAFQRLISIQKCQLQSSGNPRNPRTPCLLADGWLLWLTCCVWLLDKFRVRTNFFCCGACEFRVRTCWPTIQPKAHALWVPTRN